MYSVVVAFIRHFFMIYSRTIFFYATGTAWLAVVLIFNSISVRSSGWKSPPTSPKSPAASAKRTVATLGGVLATSTAALLGIKGYTVVQREDSIDAAMHRDLFAAHLSPSQRVLEVGFGQAANIDYYPHPAQDQQQLQLVALDPHIASMSTAQQRQLVQQHRVRGIALQLVAGSGESLPFADASFDAVVTTLVLCSVTDPQRCLAEISRVLRPGGVYICVEHVHGEPG